MSGELDSGAERQVRAHLKDCATCAGLLEARVRVRDLLRRAVRKVEAPERLAGAVRAMMRQG